MEFHPVSLMTSLGGAHTRLGAHSTEASRQVGISKQPPQMSLVQSASVHLSDLRDSEMAWWLRVTTSAGVASPSLKKTSTARLKS